MTGREPAPALQPRQVTPIAIIPPDPTAAGDASGSYVPGACNIGPQEIRRRRAFAIAGIVAAVALLAALVAVDAPAWSRLLVILPLAGGVFSWLQARRRFCAAYAFAGIANFGGNADVQHGVQDAEARRADLAAVRRMARDALLIALPITIVAVLLPV